MTSREDDELIAIVSGFLLRMKPSDNLPSANEPEWHAHFANVFRLSSAALYRGTTTEELAAFLFEGTGITAEKFNQVSPRSVERLSLELEREVNLWRLGVGNFLKISTKARTQIHSPLEGLRLEEVSRYVVASNHLIVHKTPKLYASSGTLLRRIRHGNTMHVELPVKTAQREVHQEHGIWLDDHRFFPLTVGVPDINPVRTSSMYKYPGIRIRSIDVVWWFRVDIGSVTDWHSPKLTWKRDELEFDDEGVLIRVKWRYVKN